MLIDAGAKTDVINDITGGNLLNDMASTYKTTAQRVYGRAFNQPYLEKVGCVFPDWYKNLDFSKQGTAEEIIQLLLAKNVDMQQMNTVGLSPLYNAFWQDTLANSEVVLSLINHGANIDGDPGKSQIESPAIISAAAHCNVEVMDALLKRGANINSEDRLYDQTLKNYVKGFTPLINAVRNNNLDVVKFLVEHGAKSTDGVNGYSYVVVTGCTSNVESKSAIFYAIDNNNMEMLKYLVETAHVWDEHSPKLKIIALTQKQVQDFGTFTVTTTSCISNDSYTPAKYAKAMNNMAMYDYLKSKGLGK